MSHKIDIVDQTVKITKIGIIIQDQIQTEVITQTTIELVLIQTIEIDIIQRTIPEVPHIIEIGITQTIEIYNTRAIELAKNQRTDQTLIIHKRSR